LSDFRTGGDPGLGNKRCRGYGKDSVQVHVFCRIVSCGSQLGCETARHETARTRSGHTTYIPRRTCDIPGSGIFRVEKCASRKRSIFTHQHHVRTEIIPAPFGMKHFETGITGAQHGASQGRRRQC
jgi:hypothetical protein